jgi:hypothetical protein
MNTRCLNLKTGEERHYTCDARTAVVASYAQDRGDYETWDYETRYGPLVVAGRWHWFCGDWGARREES